MTKGRAALLLLAVFLVGGICGAVSSATWMRSRWRVRALAERRTEQFAIRRIARRLDLDPEQRRKLEKVAAETRGQMVVVREDALRRFDEILDRAFDELLPTLRPDQKAKLMRMREETRRRFHREHSRRESSRRERHRHGDDSRPDDDSSREIL